MCKTINIKLHSSKFVNLFNCVLISLLSSITAFYCELTKFEVHIETEQWFDSIEKIRANHGLQWEHSMANCHTLAVYNCLHCLYLQLLCRGWVWELTYAPIV